MLFILFSYIVLGQPRFTALLHFLPPRYHLYIVYCPRYSRMRFLNFIFKISKTWRFVPF